MSDNPKEANKEMEKAIFISADCWLKVFDLLPPSQLGLGIAMISHRFDHRVDEHFKTRKWTLGNMEIRSKIGENGAKKMEIVNSDGKELPIPQNPLPNKVIGFRMIWIFFIDHNVLIFLRHFHRFFATCATKLEVENEDVRISEFLLLNIWPMLKDTIRKMSLDDFNRRQIRQLAPSMLNDCQSLISVTFYGPIYPEFPPDDSANASDGQAITKWLFLPRPDNLMKKLTICIEDSAVEQQWLAAVEQIKAAFSNASSPVYFDITVYFPPSSSLSAVVPFKLTNEMTGEKLALSKEDIEEDLSDFSLIRCPIAPDDEREQMMMMIEELDKRWNEINIFLIGNGILDGSSGASGDQKEQKK